MNSLLLYYNFNTLSNRLPKQSYKFHDISTKFESLTSNLESKLTEAFIIADF